MDPQNPQDQDFDPCMNCDDGVYITKPLHAGTLYVCNKCGHCESIGEVGIEIDHYLPYDHMDPPEPDYT